MQRQVLICRVRVLQRPAHLRSACSAMQARVWPTVVFFTCRAMQPGRQVRLGNANTLSLGRTSLRGLDQRPWSLLSTVTMGVAEGQTTPHVAQSATPKVIPLLG